MHSQSNLLKGDENHEYSAQANFISAHRLGLVTEHLEYESIRMAINPMITATTFYSTTREFHCRINQHTL